MATKLKHSKATKRTTTNSATVTPIRKYSELPDGHPDLKALAKNVDDYIAGGSNKPTPKRLTLTEAQANDLSGKVSELGMMLGAVRRLGWLIDTGGDDAAAGIHALDAISELGVYKADAITRALGGLLSARQAIQESLLAALQVLFVSGQPMSKERD